MVAVITSKGTMDKSNPKIRQHLAKRAELVAAIRLPNNAFEHAKTEVTTDILFFQKRERPIEIDADWIHVATNDDGVPMNEYFIEHPEMVLGEMVMQSGQYGQEATCKPLPNQSLQEQLQEAISHIHVETPIAYEMDDSELETDNENEIYAHPEQRPYSYCVHENEVYFKNTECMSKVELNVQDKERMKQLIALRDCTQELIQAQANGCNDEELQHFQQQLNQSYDRFSSDYGRMNDRKNKQLFDGDSSYYLLCSLEVQNEEEQFERKSDIFFQRTIGAKQVIAHVDTSYDALIVSMTQKMDVDMPLMQELTGFTSEKIEQDLQGIIFRELPNQYRDTPSFVTADDYLSGNVVERLEKVKQFLEQALPEEQSIYAQNISSLEQVQPEYLSADKIMVHIGTTWIEPHYYTQFMHETFEASPYLRSTMQVHFEKRSNEWEVSNKRSVSYNDVIAYSKYGTSEQHAYQLLENTLNLKTPVIYKTIDKKKFVDEKATLEIQQKQEELQEAFSSWLWQDPERRTTLEALYNHKFNEEIPRKYNGDFLAFESMNPLVNLRPHQKDAVARTIFGGNSLLAHEVGAGKTYEMIASAMESKRLGLCSKSLIVVLKPTVEDFATAAMTLYPSKNILVVRDKDFEKANRKKFCARIATGDYDAVIMAHSQFEKIAMSKSYQEIFIKQEIAGIVECIEDMSYSHDSGKHFSIKKLESVKKNLEHKLKKLSAENKKDDVIDFELLGIDRLYVDESHMFKNLFYKTKLQGIAGLANSESQRATDMFMKCLYLDKKTNHKGVIFATGTPLANSLVELYTNMRFLMYDKLIDKDLEHFDAWVSTYAKVDNVMELSPEGNSFRVRQRLSKFFNLPELKNLFCQVADIKTKHNMNLPLPKVHAQNVLTQPSTAQEKLMENLLERAKAIRNGSVKPEEDNMLKLTGDGKKIGLDARLMNENLPDDENSKVNTCVKNVVSLWEKHETDKATQIIFCDTSTPKKDGFNLYDDIKQKLIKQGVPEKEIAFIHDAKSDLARKKLFAKMRSGSIRILIGSTQKCGTGVNVQNRLIATHNLDCPWRPIDLEQRLGRMERQGNQFSDVYCFNYVTEKTFDSYLWQTNEHKMAFISQIMTENSPLRECEDINEATLEYSQIKALCVGDTRIQEVMQLDMDIKKLQMLESAHKKNHYNLQDKLVRTFPQQISMYKNTIESVKRDEAMLSQQKNEPFRIQIEEKIYSKPKEAKEALKNAIENAPFTPFNTSTSIGNYMGMDIRMYNGELTQSFLLQGSHTYKIDSDNFSLGQIQRKTEEISPYIQKLDSEVNHLYQQIEQAKIELQQPFLRADELKEKKARKIELTFAIKQDETKETNENETQNVAEGQDVAKEQSTDEVLPNQAIEKEQTQPKKSNEKVSIFQKIGTIKAEQHQQNECTSKAQENER